MMTTKVNTKCKITKMTQSIHCYYQ